MADNNAERHDLAEAIWMHDDPSVLTVSGHMDAEYETILNVLDRLAEYPHLVANYVGCTRLLAVMEGRA